MFRYSKLALAVTTMGLAASTGWSQVDGGASVAVPSADEGLSLADLLNIKLQTGSFLELDLAKSPLSMTIIDKNKIDVSGARHLSELLEVYVPGFQYMYNKWNGIVWGMRGVANDRNSKFIVLVNGHKMNTEARDGFFQETSMGLFGDVERIEVLRGPAGLVYGSGAIAGIVNIVTRDAIKNGFEAKARAGAWSNFSNTSSSVQGTVFGKISDDASVTATAGLEKSDGAGNGVGRIYGRASWPYPFWVSPDKSPNSVPVDGSIHATPGNWKGAIDLKVKGLRIYARATHAVQEAGGLFIKDPWPGYMGNPGDITNSIKTAQAAIAPITSRWDSLGNKNLTLTLADSIRLRGSQADSFLYLDNMSKIRALQTNSNVGEALVDGKRVPTDDPFWSSVETYNNSRREYVADNFFVDAAYDHLIGENTLKLRAAFDANTNRTQREMRPGYEASATGDERNSFIEETFGERRYTLGATYLMKSIPSMQLAVGGEQRFDDIGSDISGRNSQSEKAKRKVVSDVLYMNTALFAEGWYDVTDNFGVDVGARWDGHTRTVDQGGVINGKVAGVYTAAPGHVVKLIFQSSANNGTADNYEYNKNNFDDNGVAYDAPHFQDPFAKPGDVTVVVSGVSEEDLHKLKPEKIYSFELTSNHDFGRGLTVAPSVSYNMVRDLFAWSQDLFRVVNVGQYDHVDADLQVDWASKLVDFGASHAIQMVVNTDVDEQAETITTGDYDKTGTAWYKQNADGSYTPVPTKTKSSIVNPVRDQITADGTNFLSLNTNVSKLWVNVKPLPWLTVHNDFRVFWGLVGRDSSYKADAENGYNYLKITEDASVKWNASMHAALPNNWSVGIYAYDILGEADGDLATHAIRWQQMGESNQKDLYAMDLRSFAIDVKKAF